MQETLGWFPRGGEITWRRDRLPTPVFMGFPGGSDDKESVCNAGDLGSIPGLGNSLGGGHGNPLPIFLPEESCGQRSLVGYPWGRRVGLDWVANTHMRAPMPPHSCPIWFLLFFPLSTFWGEYLIKRQNTSSSLLLLSYCCLANVC